MELIRLYCTEVDDVPPPKVFLEWTSNATSSTLKFVCQFVLNFALAIYVNRIGDRYNDSRCSKAGRMKFFNLFFALNHPIYRECEYNDLREQVMYHPSVASIRDLNTTYAKKDGNLLHNHQCGDFKLEERVKMMKKLSPKGKMDEKMWQRVARGMDEVDRVIKHGQKLLQMENDEATRITSIENEVVKWHAVLRKSEYLVSQPDDKHVYSMTGKRLNAELCNFMEIVEEKRENYFEMAKSTNLENIRYENLVVKTGDMSGDDEISLYNSDNEE